MGIIRDSFVIFKDWANAINALPEEYQLETYKALVEFGLSGQIPQRLSPIVNAMLISFSTGMQNSILRYYASVNNGKLGGRPKKELSTEEVDKIDDENMQNVDNSQKNLEKPRITQQNLDKPSLTQHNLDEPNPNLNVNDNVYVNVNVFSQLNKNIKITSNTHAHARAVVEKTEEERAYLFNKFKDFWKYYNTEKKSQLAFEVIDTIIEAAKQAETAEKLKFNSVVYDYSMFFNLIDKLTDEDICKIVWSLESSTETIKNRAYYILGAVINLAQEKVIKTAIAR